MKLKKVSLFIAMWLLSAWAYGEPRFQTAENSNCQVYVGSTTHTVQWNGACHNGKAHGNGTVQYLENNQVYLTYQGNMHQGKSHGQGTYTFADGAKHVGQNQNGKKHGQGTCTWADGKKYVGQFLNGDFNGQGTFTWPSGKRYVGQFRDSNLYGEGVMYYPNGTSESKIWNQPIPRN